mmetsp:Transcript_79179/g.227057  ORF Transcript_79179/g.227057 Transcript_79179/m.227057 type:complete len:167 (-) Transcript_79179:1002-1502(-)
MRCRSFCLTRCRAGGPGVEATAIRSRSDTDADADADACAAWGCEEEAEAEGPTSRTLEGGEASPDAAGGDQLMEPGTTGSRCIVGANGKAVVATCRAVGGGLVTLGGGAGVFDPVASFFVPGIGGTGIIGRTGQLPRALAGDTWTCCRGIVETDLGGLCCCCCCCW